VVRIERWKRGEDDDGRTVRDDLERLLG